MKNIIDNIKRIKWNKQYIIAALIFIISLLIFEFIAYKSINKDAYVPPVIENPDNNNDEEDSDDDSNVIENLNNQEVPSINNELDSLSSFAIKYDSDQNKNLLVALTNKGTEIGLLDINATQYGSYLYDYYKGKLYIYIDANRLNDDNTTSYDNKNILGYIDLTKGNGNYEFTEIVNLEIGNDQSGFAVFEDSVYISNGFSGNVIAKYSFNTGQLSYLDLVSDTTSMTNLYGVEDTLIYNFNNDIYALDTITDDKYLIVNDASSCFVKNGKLIYRKYNIANNYYEDVQYYEYDIEHKKHSAITDKFNYGGGSLGYEQIIPYDDGYAFVNTTKLYYSKDNNTKELYDFENSVFSLIRISLTKVLVTTIEDLDANSNNIIYDFETKTIATLDKPGIYTYLVYYE